jgi:uncharacterized protein (TIGR02301 family)
MRRTVTLVLAAALAAPPLAPASAAETQSEKKPAAAAPAAQAPPAPVAPAAPPYQPQLLRLAELMGALAYLRDLCGHRDGDEFRAKMTALLATDAVDAERRDLLAGAYNKGFADYARSYHTCGPVADAVIKRYLVEASRLAADVASRYGG